MEKKTQLVHLKDGTSLLVPFILITSLFFLWGFAHSILDVLNKHFQDALGITKTKSALVQAVVYGGYFLMALPAGAIIRRWGYRTGVLTGLLLYGVGALLFIPGGSLQSFGFFLFSLFVIGCGLTCLETAANPYVTVLGEPAAANGVSTWPRPSTDWGGSADRWWGDFFSLPKTVKAISAYPMPLSV